MGAPGPLIPPVLPEGRRRTVDVREVLNGIFSIAQIQVMLRHLAGPTRRASPTVSGQPGDDVPVEVLLG